MASNSRSSQEDPLIAALPPNTDYITYLTILEYQLKPDNLATLNRLLLADDGTLASEIGWDLLKLVLPILHVNPSETKRCLDIVARRGNPREVIVRVAEELALIGDHNAEDEDVSEGNDQDELPTFAGEAPRVHLGEMKLHGMPESANGGNSNHQSAEQIDAQTTSEHDELVFQALISMLPALHQRIRTKHPSRFLATSLPAAFGAYRRLSMNPESTIAFLDALTRLGGKKGPRLPPRESTTSTSHGALNTSALAPDVEAEITAGTPDETDRLDTAIIVKLLQATLLEILDESVSATEAAENPHLVHTDQIRLKQNEGSMTSVRKGEVEADTPVLEAMHAIERRFMTTAQALNIDFSQALSEIFSQEQSIDDDDEEYPTTPAQISLPKTGLLLLYTLQDPLPSSEPDEQLFRLFSNTIADRSQPPSFFAIDLLLSFLYTTVSTLTHIDSTSSQTFLTNRMHDLKHLFLLNPIAVIRDAAHDLATTIFHHYMTGPSKLDTLHSLLTEDTVLSALSKSVALDWLKDAIAPSHPTASVLNEHGLPITAALDLSDQNLLFPPASQEIDGELPWIIASLNLFCVLMSVSARKDKVTDLDMSVTRMSGKAAKLIAELEPHLDQLRSVLGSEDVPFTDIFALEDTVARVKIVLEHGSE